MSKISVEITVEWQSRGTFLSEFTLQQEGGSRLVRQREFKRSTIYYAYYKTLMYALLSVHDAVVSVSTPLAPEFLDELETLDAPIGNMGRYLKSMLEENNITLQIQR